ncbi:MAG: nucleotidyltransferase family protein [Firmicutes bacterium]|nr:nucleotidyltransferase family protein [Bacillota bacterium]
MKAIILAAGYATRLYPLTKDRPKPLLPIREKPIIDYIVDQIGTIPAVDRIFVVTNHKFAGHFEKWAAEGKRALPVTVVDDGTTDNETRLGAIGDIAFTLGAGKIDDEILIIAGDNYSTYPLREQYDFYAEKGGDCLCAQRIADAEDIKRYAVAQIDGDGKVLSLVEKPQNPLSDLAVFATYIYTRDTAALFQKYLAEGNNPDAPGHFPQWLYKRKPVYVYIMNGECYDIGTLQSYEEVQAL